MKNLIFIVLVLSNLVVIAQTPSELFSKANQLYKSAKFEEAAKVYESIEKQGLQSADLYYNIGNCYYKLSKVAPSIYYYEKALKLNPGHSDALSNLTFAKRMTIDIVEELPKTFLQRFSINIIQKFSFDTWAIFAVIASFLTAIFFLVYYFSTTSKLKLVLFNASILAFFIVLVCGFFAIKNYETIKNTRVAVIFSAAVDVKNAPTIDGEEVFELHEGTKVYILDELDNWVKIKLADGKEGWMLTNKLREI